MGADGLVRDWNPAAELMFGYKREEVLGRELASLIIPDSLRESHRVALLRYVQGGHPRILDRRLLLSGLVRDGTQFPVELTITRVPDVEPPLFTGFVRDL